MLHERSHGHEFGHKRINIFSTRDLANISRLKYPARHFSCDAFEIVEALSPLTRPVLLCRGYSPKKVPPLLLQPPTLIYENAANASSRRFVCALIQKSDRESAKVLVSSGSGVVDTITVIVDPELLIPCPPGHVGEIWLRVRSMGVGYWNQPEETRRTFAASLADTGEGQFLRTGDLGFIYDGEVFITGRLKDVVIIRGRNLYPQDIELTVQHVHPALRPGGGAAFSMDVGGEERLVVVQELDPRVLPVDTEAVASDVRQAVSEAYGVAAYAVVLIRAGTLPKTSSGKVQRGACRSAFLSRQLETVWPRA